MTSDEGLCEAPLDPCEALRGDAGLVLQGRPLTGRSSLDAEGPFAFDDLAVFRSRDIVFLWDRVSSESAAWAALVTSVVVALLWSWDCVTWVVVVERSAGVEGCDGGNGIGMDGARASGGPA